jgi:D-alanine-D-alanine ligase
MADARLPRPASRFARSAPTCGPAARGFGLPLAVKPSREGSTIGFTKVVSEDQSDAAYSIARRHDDDVLCEQFVDGRELTVALLGTGPGARALPVIEMVAPPELRLPEQVLPGRSLATCARRISRGTVGPDPAIALSSFQASDARAGRARDVMLRRSDDEPFLLEINTSPA